MNLNPVTGVRSWWPPQAPEYQHLGMSQDDAVWLAIGEKGRYDLPPAKSWIVRLPLIRLLRAVRYRRKHATIIDDDDTAKMSLYHCWVEYAIQRGWV